jgi:CrcB protein
MFQVIIVGLGGFIGASLRYIVSQLALKVFGSGFPYGTLIVNVVGAVLIGFITALSLRNSSITPNTKLFLTTGILGGLTTFSTFSNETASILSSGAYLQGILNIVLNLGLCLIGVVGGKLIAG